jgi:hypothetical protein
VTTLEDPAKKRKSVRAPLEIDATVEPIADGGERGAVAARATIGNLGPDGAYVKTSAKLAQGGRVMLQFKLPSHPIGFAIAAEIRWVKPEGAGVQFVDFSAYERSVIDDYCQRLVDDARGAGGGSGGD